MCIDSPAFACLHQFIPQRPMIGLCSARMRRIRPFQVHATLVVPDRRKLILPEAIKSLGDHTVPLKLHREVTVPLVIHVVKEGATE